ncbi:hypothetical protein FOZ62_002693 [Perkinsus olseni]|uniref:Uncharacterized protein n=1 Tax=Perkinsus olseni TaxID=32597 RepID=A0A7J6RVE2_PEROL|nr:hypothetical protein FOZ62_002693 [Perkinsus olseni]
MSPSISNLRLYCSFLLLAQIAQVVLTLKAGLMSVVADHPQGCYGYKGPSHVSDDMYVREDACIYSMKGENERGEFMEATGIRIESSRQGQQHVGVQFSVCGLNFGVKASGSAVVKLKADGNEGQSGAYNLSGQAAYFGTILDGYAPIINRRGDIMLTVRQTVQMLSVEGGWSYHVSFGYAERRYQEELMIAKGVLYS